MKVHPPNDTNFDDPTPVYSLISPMTSNIFNLNLIVHNLDGKPFFKISEFCHTIVKALTL